MRKSSLYFIFSLVGLLFVVSCASIGNPSGGPRDEDPPRFIAANPPLGATEVTPNKVVLTFDELVTLRDAFTKVVVSPPGVQTPRVSSLGKRVTVEFRDSLLPETTYTINFGDAIVDNNEGNKLENFIYTFSTGPVLDSLMVSGMVLDALDLEPAQGIYVGLHSNPADSAFTKTRFDRIAKTDESGKFVIGGLAPGQYRIYALEDKDGDLAWSSPEESLAFFDTFIEPYVEQTVATDTIFDLKTGAIDTIVNRGRSRFLPNNILLRTYNTGFRQQYITKYERIDSSRINLLFNAPADSMPVVDVIVGNRIFPVSEVAVTERSAGNDSISFWLRDREVISSDTLRLALRYLRADSVYNMVAVSDTLRLITQKQAPKKESNLSKAMATSGQQSADSLASEIPFFQIQATNQKVEFNSPFIIEFPKPSESFDLSAVRLQWKDDSIYLPVPEFDPAIIVNDSLNPRRWVLNFPWKYETTYRLTVDSLAVSDIYGAANETFSQEFKIRPETEYGSIRLNLSNFGTDSVSRFVQLLNGSGNPVVAKKLENGSVTFDFLLAGTYNVRVVEDLNDNGVWDPGDFYHGVQPDVAYYYPQTIELKANWDQELDWNVFATPVDMMKPEKIRVKKQKK